MPVTQDWGDDLFADGATTDYGTHPNLYVGIQPSSAADGATGYSLKFGNGELYDGYQRSEGVASGIAGFGTTTGSLEDFASWCVERATITDDVEVSMTPAILPIAGLPDLDTLRQSGICSHVTGGIRTELSPGVTSTEYWRDVSGYFLIETKNTFDNSKMFLLQIDAGVITVVGQELVKVGDIAQQNVPNSAGEYFRPTKLRMTVDSTGGNALITCFRTTEAGVEVQLFGATFNLGVALPDGRCGFGFQTRRVAINGNGNDSVGVANVFSIRSSDSSTRFFVDRFQRLQPRAAAELKDGLLAFLGHSLMSRWTGDGKSRTTGNFEGNGYLVRGATADQIETGADLTGSIDWPGFFLRQSPPRTRAQHVATNIIRLNVDAGTRSETGVLLRFTAQTIEPPAFVPEIDLRGRFDDGSRAAYYKSGYSVSVVHDTGATPVWELQIRHYNGSQLGDERGLLLATADLTASGLIIGTAFELDVEIRNFDEDVFGQGDLVAIISKINTVTITPVVENILGIVETDGFLVDGRSGAATVDIGGMGLYFNPDVRGTADMVAFLDFTEKALTSPPRIDPDEQASVTIAAETGGVSGTLSTPLDTRVGESSRSESLLHRFEGGKLQPIRMQSQNRKLYDVSAIMENAEWEALSELIGSNGNHTPFNWTHPYTDEALVVLFVEDSLGFEERHTEDGRTIYSVSFQIERLFAQATFNPQA